MIKQFSGDNFPVIMESDNTSYYIATLSIPSGKKEMFYRIAYPSEFPAIAKDVNLNRHAGKPDHISVHENGRMQMTYKNHRRNSQEIHKFMGQTPDLAFLPQDKNLLTPLFMDNIYLSENVAWQLPTYKGHHAQTITWKIKERQHFSVLTFLIHKDLSPSLYLNQNGFSPLWHPDTTLYAIEIFAEWKILVLLSDFYHTKSHSETIDFEDSHDWIGRSFTPLTPQVLQNLQQPTRLAISI